MKWDKASNLVINEYDRACKLFPSMHSGHEGLAIVEEEFEELKKMVFLKQSNPIRNRRMCEEAIHLGAMTLRFLTDVIKETNNELS